MKKMPHEYNWFWPAIIVLIILASSIYVIITKNGPYNTGTQCTAIFEGRNKISDSCKDGGDPSQFCSAEGPSDPSGPRIEVEGHCIQPRSGPGIIGP